MRKTEQSAPVIEVSNLSVWRGEVRVLADVEWRVDRGQHWVILGANGSGKTSLLKTLCGYVTASAGEVRVLGGAYGQVDWREVRRRVGLVSAALQASVPDHELALRTVVSGRTAQLDLWQVPTREEVVEASGLLSRVGAGGLAERPWGVLSQGERQRVLLARALMSRPALLILDEPCAGLDPVARERFLSDMGRFLQVMDGPSVVLVTHHLEEVTAGFSHALLLKEGRVMAAGVLDRVLSSVRVSAAFGTKVTVRRRVGRWSLKVG